jgi:hypothetical protein
MSEEDIGEHNEQLSAALESAAQRENRITVCCISTGFVRATDQDYRRPSRTLRLDRFHGTYPCRAFAF